MSTEKLEAARTQATNNRISEALAPILQTTPKKRKARRNLAKERESLLNYLKVAIEAYESIEPPSDYYKGQIAAFRMVLKRMEGEA